MWEGAGGVRSGRGESLHSEGRKLARKRMRACLRELTAILATGLLLAPAAPGSLSAQIGPVISGGAQVGEVVVTAPFLHAAVGPDEVDRAQLLRDVQVLAHDSMEGRQTGTPGNERARRYLLERFEEIGLLPFGDSYEHSFPVEGPGGAALEGVNVVGRVDGSGSGDHVLVVTAHYDHLGVRNGEIYNGADDNASGTAGLLALARRFVEHPPEHTIVFAAMDAEEMGLQGARAFISDPPVDVEHIELNVNMDMVSRSEAGELYAAGTYHYPSLGELLDEVEPAGGLELLRGHDRPDLPPGEDWTMASDHAAFHEEGIPFLYFGVEDHPGYHDPSDAFEDITPDFFVDAVTTVLRFTQLADARLGDVAERAPAP